MEAAGNVIERRAAVVVDVSIAVFVPEWLRGGTTEINGADVDVDARMDEIDPVTAELVLECLVALLVPHAPTEAAGSAHVTSALRE